ncbi:hypothetical protein VSK93_05055 [Clostridioides difficile]
MKMTVFFSFFEKSATKHQIGYRYGARKENSTFLKNGYYLRLCCTDMR